MQHRKTKTPRAAQQESFPDVLTPAEAADYLRVPEKDVVELADRGELPGRKIKTNWRFCRQALAEWLSSRSAKERLMCLAGVGKDDPYVDQMLEEIYRERGRPMVERRE